MKLEDQVCSLELAKRLKELGVKQDAMWTWWFDKNHNDYEVWPTNPPPTSEMDERWERAGSAFTVGELGDMLPLKFATSREKNKGKLEYAVVSWGMNLPIRHECKYSTNEADARAKMVIYLIENKLITP